MLSCLAVLGQQQEWIIASPTAEYNPNTGVITGDEMVIRYLDTVLSANRVRVNRRTGEVEATGRVRIERGEGVWVGEHIRYNFFTHEMVSEEFRAGYAPLFAAGKGLSADVTNEVYTATNAIVTSDDVEYPFEVVRAKYIKLRPGESIEVRHATLRLGKVPVFYWPYYKRKFGERQNRLDVLPGYRSSYGPFLLTTYHWYFNDELDTAIHLDYRQKRGVGVGPDFNFDYGRSGRGGLSYYYTYDDAPDTDADGLDIPHNRQLFNANYYGTPGLGLTVKGTVNYQSDPLIRRDYFESEYQDDPQPITFGEVRRKWDNLSMDVFMQARVNDFYGTVERLPDVRLSYFPTPIADSPLQYEGQTSVGYYGRLYAQTNSVTQPDYWGARADTFHQITLPWTFFNWLQVTPKVGGRLTYYGDTDGPGAMTERGTRGIFNTGVEVSTRASRVWPGSRSKLLDVDGIRHIIQPGVNYTYVPTPNRLPSEVPQYDYQLPSLLPLPIEFPEFNSIGAIDAENVMRLGLRNRVQTKRKGRVEDLINWNMFIDWRITQRTNQSVFGSFFSAIELKPRSWLTIQSQTQFDVNEGDWLQALNGFALEPNDTWSWGLSHWYLQDGWNRGGGAPVEGDHNLRSLFYWRLNENWGVRFQHLFGLDSGKLEEQYYTIYRDLRSFTTALTFRYRNPPEGENDFTVAVTLSLKAFPRGGLHTDAVRPAQLVGY